MYVEDLRLTEIRDKFRIILILIKANLTYPTLLKKPLNDSCPARHEDLMDLS